MGAPKTDLNASLGSPPYRMKPHHPYLILVSLYPCFYVPETGDLQLSSANAFGVLAVEARTSFSVAEVYVGEAVHARP